MITVLTTRGKRTLPPQISGTIPYEIPEIPATKTDSIETPIPANAEIPLKGTSEQLTFQKGNYVHFLASNCEITKPITKLLLDQRTFDPEELRA